MKARKYEVREKEKEGGRESESEGSERKERYECEEN